MMGFEKAAGMVVRSALEATVLYEPNPASMYRNRNKALAAFAAAGALAMLPGPDYISGMLSLYATAKSYQSVRDWAGK